MRPEEEEKKRAGAVAPAWGGEASNVALQGGSAAARSGTGFLSGSRAAGTLLGRLSSQPGLLGKLGVLLSSRGFTAAVLLTGFAASGYGLYDMKDRGGFGVERAGRNSPLTFQSSRDSDGPLLSDGAGPSARSGLDLASQANKGALDAPGAQAGVGAKPAEGGTDPAGTSDEALAAQAQGTGGGKGADLWAAARRMAAGGFGSSLKDRGFGNLSGGSGGMSAGIGEGFRGPKLGAGHGSAQAFARPTTGRLARGMMPANQRGGSNLRGATAKRLQNMNRVMAPTKSASPEFGSAVQGQQWTNASPGGTGLQGGLSGGGISAGGANTGGTGVSNPGGGSGGGEGGPIEEGDPGAGGDASTAPEVDGKNVTPYQGMVDIAVIMLMAAAVLLLLSYLVGMLGKTNPVCYTIAKYLAYAAMACAAVTALMGLAIMAQSGQIMQGLIFTGLGALLTYLSYTAAEGNAKAAATAQQLLVGP